VDEQEPQAVVFQPQSIVVLPVEEIVVAVPLNGRNFQVAKDWEMSLRVVGEEYFYSSQNSSIGKDY
jgi:hypothetical protein